MELQLEDDPIRYQSNQEQTHWKHLLVKCLHMKPYAGPGVSEGLILQPSVQKVELK